MARLPAEMNEGPEAFDRFRKAMKTIIGVPKTAVIDRQKAHASKKKKATSHKS